VKTTYNLTDGSLIEAHDWISSAVGYQFRKINSNTIVIGHPSIDLEFKIGIYNVFDEKLLKENTLTYFSTPSFGKKAGILPIGF